MPLVKALAELGAALPLVLVDRLPDSHRERPPCNAVWHEVLDGTRTDTHEAFRLYWEVLSEPDSELRRTVDSYDPERSALVLVSSIGRVRNLLGRIPYGLQPQNCTALEDKTLIVDFWKLAGIPYAPASIVPVTASTAWKTAELLDHGRGTVWAGDCRDIIHFGCELTRWVRSPQQADETLKLFGRCCDRVRIMPFLDGLPCSIHGIVCPKGVVVLRPVENIILRRPNTMMFLYAGTSTYWEPSPAQYVDIRDIGRRVGHALAAEFDYRGFYTVDGILTKDGFRPTELNARMGAGVGQLGATVPDLPLDVLDYTIRAREELDFVPTDLENLLLARSSTIRNGSAALEFIAQSSSKRLAVRFVGVRATLAVHDPPDGYLLFESQDQTTFVTFLPLRHRTPVGPPLCSKARQVFDLADELLESGVGPFEGPF